MIEYIAGMITMLVLQARIICIGLHQMTYTIVIGGTINNRGCSSVGRAPALHAGGRWFDSSQLHQILRL